MSIKRDDMALWQQSRGPAAQGPAPRAPLPAAARRLRFMFPEVWARYEALVAVRGFHTATRQ